MRRGLAFGAALAIATVTNAQVQPKIRGYELSTGHQPHVVSMGVASGLLDNDVFKHFDVTMSMHKDEYVFVFSRLWVEPGVVGGVSVGAAVVEALVSTHENLRPPPYELPTVLQAPPGYTLEVYPEIEPLGIESHRIMAFVNEAIQSESLASYGFRALATGTWTMNAASSLPASKAAEQQAWGKPGVWLSQPSVMGHVSSLIHDTFEQSLHYEFGAAAQHLAAVQALSSYINEYVTANVAIQVVVVDPENQKVKIKIPVRIRRRSVKQVDDPQRFRQEGLPTWFPTALFSAIHVAEAGSSMTVPMLHPVTGARLVWSCTKCPSAPHLILEQTEDSYGSKLPRFIVPATIVADLAEYESMPFGYVLDPEDQPLLPQYNWGGPGGIVTYPIRDMSSSQKK